MSTGATRVEIDGTVFERIKLHHNVGLSGPGTSGTAEPVEVPIGYAWYVNGLRVDPKTFQERFDEAVAQRNARHAAKRQQPKELKWTDDDCRFLRSLRIKSDEDEKEQAA